MSDLIKKTLVWTEDGKIEAVDTIENDKKLWLVPFWSDLPGQKLTRPGRLIRIDSLSYQKNQTHPNVAFVLNEILPKSLFDPTFSEKQKTQFEVVELPDIWFERQIEE
jgi:hypothetical protein